MNIGDSFVIVFKKIIRVIFASTLYIVLSLLSLEIRSCMLNNCKSK